MRCKQIKVGHLACAVAMGLVAVAPAAHAQSDMSTTTTSTTTSMSQPTLVTGTVLRYYVDRSGYVTAMDVQTAEGVQFVRFSPGMGTRLYNTYPVGGTASVYVTGSPASRWDVVSVGATAPAPGGMMMPYTVTDAELLDAEPYIMAGAKMVTVTGKLRNMIVNDRGEIVGLVLGGGNKGGGKMEAAATSPDGTTMTSSSTAAGDTTTTTSTTTSTTTTTNMTATDSTMAMQPRGILVRVPREFRHIATGYAGTERVTPLFKGAVVEVTGYPEAPRFGVLDIYNQRIAANALVVNGRAVGALGIPMMSPKATRALFGGVDIGGTGRTSEEMRAAGMGYTVYGTSNTMGGEPAMTTDAAGTASTGGTASDGTTMR
jgi:hypothetical protein